MNYGLVKKLVIDSQWTGAKSGDEYRSLVIQVDNIIRFLSAEDSPLKILPDSIMTEHEMMRVVLHIMEIKKTNREVLNNLKQPGIKRQLYDFIISDAEKRNSKIVRKGFARFGKIRIKDILEDVQTFQRMAWLEQRVNLKTSVTKISNVSNRIQEALAYENGIAKSLGVRVHTPRYMEEYIDFVDGAVSEILIFSVFLNDSITDKRAFVDFIWIQINRITDEAVIDYAKKEQDAIKKVRSTMHEYKGLEVFTEYLVLYLIRQSLYEELDKIYDTLISEMEEHPELFDYDSSNGDVTDLKSRILLNSKCSDFKSKLYETYKILKLGCTLGNRWISPVSISDLRVIFRETYLSQCKYDKRKTMRIARQLLYGQEVSRAQKLFYDQKILRGLFCELGIKEWYQDYIRITRKIRQQLLLQYRCFDDLVSYKAINRIIYDFCDILYHYGNE